MSVAECFQKLQSNFQAFLQTSTPAGICHIDLEDERVLDSFFELEATSDRKCSALFVRARSNGAYDPSFVPRLLDALENTIRLEVYCETDVENLDGLSPFIRVRSDVDEAASLALALFELQSKLSHVYKHIALVLKFDATPSRHFVDLFSGFVQTSASIKSHGGEPPRLILSDRVEHPQFSNLLSAGPEWFAAIDCRTNFASAVLTTMATATDAGTPEGHARMRFTELVFLARSLGQGVLAASLSLYEFCKQNQIWDYLLPTVCVLESEYCKARDIDSLAALRSDVVALYPAVPEVARSGFITTHEASFAGLCVSLNLPGEAHDSFARAAVACREPLEAVQFWVMAAEQHDQRNHSARFQDLQHAWNAMQQVPIEHRPQASELLEPTLNSVAHNASALGLLPEYVDAIASYKHSLNETEEACS